MHAEYEVPNGHGTAALSEPQTGEARLTVLVVDDDREALEALEGALAAQGHRVITAVDGREALDQAPRLRPDLVITDLLMPVLDGIGLAKALRADPLTSTTRIVLCSGVAEGSVRPLFSDYDAFLRKPFELDELARAIGRLRVR